MSKFNFIVILSFLLLAGCISNIKYHGHLVSNEEVAKIKPTKTAKEQISTLLGSPSVKTDIGGENWLYISSKIISRGFISAKIVERNILVIGFDKNNIVNDLKTFTLADGNNIKLSKDYTPTKGTRSNIVKHFIKNIGRFNTKESQKFPGKPRGI